MGGLLGTLDIFLVYPEREWNYSNSLEVFLQKGSASRALRSPHRHLRFPEDGWKGEHQQPWLDEKSAITCAEAAKASAAGGAVAGKVQLSGAGAAFRLCYGTAHSMNGCDASL